MQRFGVLCAPARQHELAAAFRALPEGLPPAVVFTLQNMDLSARTVTGLVTGNSARQNETADNSSSTEEGTWAETALPGLIFNLSVQHKKAEVRTLRTLDKTDGVTLLNPSNRLNQIAVLQMLHVEGPAPGLTPFFSPEPEDVETLTKLSGFLLRPVGGCRPQETVFVQKRDDGFDLYNPEGAPHCRIHDLETALVPFARGRWVVQELPELLLRHGIPVGQRVYLLRMRGVFRVMGRLPLTGTAPTARYAGLSDSACASLCSRAGEFLPGLIACYADFVFARVGMPVFCGLGGWDVSIAHTSKGRILQQSMCAGLASYAAARFEAGSYNDMG